MPSAGGESALAFSNYFEYSLGMPVLILLCHACAGCTLVSFNQSATGEKRTYGQWCIGARVWFAEDQSRRNVQLEASSCDSCSLLRVNQQGCAVKKCESTYHLLRLNPP